MSYTVDQPRCDDNPALAGYYDGLLSGYGHAKKSRVDEFPDFLKPTYLREFRRGVRDGFKDSVEIDAEIEAMNNAE